MSFSIGSIKKKTDVKCVLVQGEQEPFFIRLAQRSRVKCCKCLSPQLTRLQNSDRCCEGSTYVSGPKWFPKLQRL